VLIDVAHACLATVEEQFEIRLSATHPAYGRLLSLFEPSLRQQHPASLLQLKDEDPYAVMLVPPWDWYDQQDRVLGILHPHREDDHLGWGWPLISGVLPALTRPTDLFGHAAALPVRRVPRRLGLRPVAIG
jgi:hypothetical protein